ncbi:MAG: ABC-F family ATP-binding cassette domain-containing protein [Gemmatimonadetes bacterium]|nr:ABC-F family ATP-binding cassette domain-containing protein [Gemmatimonadota bacterium]MCC6769654.1 ABC-F family ATP-binding cassette domain-containing protein [Gemmatimonadaceae bacterium]
MTQFSFNGVGVSFGATTILRDVTFTVAAGEKWGVIGRNGAGKTTLFRLLTAAMQPSVGTMAKTPNLRFAVLDQHREFPGVTTVWGAVADAFRELIGLEADLARQADALAHAGEHVTEQQLNRYAHDLERFEHEGGYTYVSRVDAVLQGLGFDAVGAKSEALTHLSGGERGRVALARQLVIPADVMLLDEPTNHLDLETTRWLEEYLRETDETILVISHDRAFLDRVVNHVLHLEDQTAVPYDGGYSHFVRQRAERRLSQTRAFDKQSKAIAKEEDYVRRNIAGQNTKQAKGRRKRLEWLPRLSPPPDDDSAMAVRFLPGDRGGDLVAIFEHAKVQIGERTLLHDFTEWVRRGDVVGLIGPNGTGKSTLLKALFGERELAGGEIRMGGGVKATMYRQDFANVPRTKSLYNIIGDMRPMWERGAIQGHLGMVQFSGDEVMRSASSLSGGELARVALAMMMLEGANLLVFDEPTNHLDVESIEQLEDAIERFAGTVVLVSHDRELLRKLVTRVWELRDGKIRVFDGDFAEFEEVREREEKEQATRVAAAAAERRAQDKAAAKKRTERDSKSRGNARDIRRNAERAESRVTELEQKVASLDAAIADPEIFASPNGRARATAMSRELAQVKQELATAMATWESALAASESLDAT